ncbi:MAG: hypothetical protein IJ834_07000 [Paludibacteraceae bacterium]|nr:hypothetical protein [Paludibacteraceae bacterium]
MKKYFLFVLTVSVLCGLVLFSCKKNEQTLEERALQLCDYVPDHALVDDAQDYLTSDFYDALEEAFEVVNNDYTLDNDWIYYFVSGNGGSTPRFNVLCVNQIDEKNAAAEIEVQQVWEDGTVDENKTYHQLEMQKVDGEWLLSDFDGKKSDCIYLVENARKQRAACDAISNYLLQEKAPFYAHPEGSDRAWVGAIPTVIIVSADDANESDILVWGDYWVFWYVQNNDTLECVSGGAHPGLMHLKQSNEGLEVHKFDAVGDGSTYLPTAKAIFKEHFDDFSLVTSDEYLREDVRLQTVAKYVVENDLEVHYIKDYGRDPVELPIDKD